jgi:hypothetical protein
MQGYGSVWVVLPCSLLRPGTLPDQERKFHLTHLFRFLGRPLYIAKYWDGLILFLSDGRIEIDNNTVERAIRPIALNRKNALFAGHDAGAQNWTVIASLIETCKLNGIEPHTYLCGVLTAIAGGHK